MIGKRDGRGLVGRPPESRKRGPTRKPVSYVSIYDDNEGNLGSSLDYSSLISRNSVGPEKARVFRSIGRRGGLDGLCSEKDGMEIVDFEAAAGDDDDDDEDDDDYDYDYDYDGDDDDEDDDDYDYDYDDDDDDDDEDDYDYDGDDDDDDDDYDGDGSLNENGRAGVGVGGLVAMKCDDVSSGVDPDYQRFLEMLRVDDDGNAYCVELSVSDGLSFVLAYEEGSGGGGGQPRPRKACGSGKQSGRGSNACPVGGRPGPQAMMRGSREQIGEEADGVLVKRSRRENPTARDGRGPKGSKRKFGDVSTGVMPQCVNKIALELGPCRPDMRASKRLGLQNFQVENEVVPDKDYLIILNSLNTDGNQILNSLNMDGNQNNHSSSDSDVMILDINPSKSRTPLVVLDSDDEEFNNISNRSDCPLRKQLLELLQWPHDESELKAHMERFQRRLPKDSRKETRSGHTLKTEVAGRSYEDWHGDLADQIRSSKEKPKTLNLLRGFFFWLKNKAHESMFKPWKDPSCLEVLPAGC